MVETTYTLRRVTFPRCVRVLDEGVLVIKTTNMYKTLTTDPPIHTFNTCSCRLSLSRSTHDVRSIAGGISLGKYPSPDVTARTLATPSPLKDLSRPLLLPSNPRKSLGGTIVSRRRIGWHGCVTFWSIYPCSR